MKKELLLFFLGVMMYLYHGGSHSLKVEAGDVLELMAAANFFQLPGLLDFKLFTTQKIGIRGVPGFVAGFYLKFVKTNSPAAYLYFK